MQRVFPMCKLLGIASPDPRKPDTHTYFPKIWLLHLKTSNYKYVLYVNKWNIVAKDV